jgi:hypothetical protein
MLQRIALLVLRLASLRGALTILALVFAFYLVVLYPWIMSWGTTPEERAMTLPGDALHPTADVQVTRAITIEAPPEEVWAWIIQMGQDRAGFYSYDWLENLFAADIHNTDRVVPEWQEPQVGDLMPLARLDYLGGRVDASRPHIELIESPRSLVVLGFASFELLPTDDNATRLLVRDWQGSIDDPLILRATLRGYNIVFWDPAHFIMQRQMMRGLQARAEGKSLSPGVVESAGWIGATLVVAALFALSRHWGWLVVPLVPVIPILLSTGDVRAALAGFLAIGITLLGAVHFGRHWWPPYTVLAASVLLILLLARDAHVAFGLLFLVTLIATFAAVIPGWLDLQLSARSRIPRVT